MKSKANNAVGPRIRAAAPKAGKLLPILGGVSLLGGLQAATQYFAHTAGYHVSLGANVEHIYAPWSILVWLSKWHNQYPDEIMRAGGIGMVTAALGLLGVAIAKVVTSNSAKASEYLHGSARWAEKKDIQAAGLLPRERNVLEIVTGKAVPTASGVYVGGWQDKDGKFHYLRHSGPEHVLTYAPTRSGKGVGLVVPTLLSWGASCVITDLKGELWALTAGWRSRHAKNKVLRFEPASTSGACWNPLAEIRLGTEYEVGDVQNLVTLIVDPDGKGLASHWDKTAFALLVGVVLHALYKVKGEGGTATLPSVDAMLSDPNRDINELWIEMTTYGHVNGQNHPAIGSAARDMIDRPEEEAGSVLSTAKSYLALYRDPVVARNVSRSDFRIKDLMHSDDPVSLYIVTQPNDKARLRPLVRVMVNMIVRLLADKMDFQDGRPVAHYKHRMLMMLDEFPSLGKLEIMQESLAFVAGYGIKCYLICQDINQLRSRETGYGHDESITSNCHVQNAYPPNRVETAEHLSRLTGQTTVVKEQITTSGRRTAAMLGQVSRTYQEVQRPLLTPDECLRMPGPKKNDKGEIEEAGDMVIYVAGYPAIYGKQPLYFKDPVFQARAAIPAPFQSTPVTGRHPERDYPPEGGGFQRITIGVAIAGVAALVLAAGGYAAGARINTTKSIPVGLYWTSSASVEKGAYVLWCPPKAGVFDDAKERGYIGAGFCSGDYGYMMKRVLAAKDDAVSVADDGVRVNGELLPHSKPIQADKSGRALPRFQVSTYTLGNAELLLMSDVSDTSFDGRYFGPINRSQVRAVIRPVIIW